jgi:hypothetical protein
MTLVERGVLLSPALLGARFFALATFVAPALVFVAAAFRAFEAARTLDFDLAALAIAQSPHPTYRSGA